MKSVFKMAALAALIGAAIGLSACASKVDVTAHDKASRAVAAIDQTYTGAVNAIATYAELPLLGTPACDAVTVGKIKPCHSADVVAQAIAAARAGDKLLDDAWAAVNACPVDAASCDMSAVEGAAQAAVNDLLGILAAAGVSIQKSEVEGARDEYAIIDLAYVPIVVKDESGIIFIPPFLNFAYSPIAGGIR